MRDRSATPGLVHTVGGIALVCGLGLAAWEGVLRQDDAEAHWSVLAVIAAVLVTAAVAGRGRQRRRSIAWARRGGSAVLHPISAAGLRARGRPGEGSFPGPGRRPASLVAGTVAWTVLIAATIGWDLYSFAAQAHGLPTLSRLFGDVTVHPVGRAVVFAGWLALGAYLAAGGRRTTS